MAIQWSTTSAVSNSNGVKALIYSESGGGKTMLCATAPRPLVISAESGLLSLAKKNIERVFGINTPGVSYDIPVAHVTTVKDLTEILAWLQSPQARDKDGTNFFSSICIDSISEVGEVVLANAKALVKDPRQAYGELLEKMEATIKAYRDLAGYNVFMFAKSLPMKDEASGVVKYGPAMPGSKLGPMLPYYFDEVLRLGIAKPQGAAAYRFLQTAPDLQYIAKDRSGQLAEVEKPDLTYIVNKILGA